MRHGPGMIGHHSHRCGCDDCRRAPRPVRVAVDLSVAVVVTLAALAFLTLLAAVGLRRFL